MRNQKWRDGTVRIQITCAEPMRLISQICSAGVELMDICYQDCLTVQISAKRTDLHIIQQITAKNGGEGKLVWKKGIYWKITGILRRPFFLLGILLILALTLYLPRKVLFIYVEGNQTVLTREILEAAEKCGIVFWADRSEIRSEKLKNGLLNQLPQLQWAGINTSGCVATITVRERDDAQQQQMKEGVSSIVAARDGIIQEMTVTKGTALCQVGQAVKAGQTLVSGYTDCGITIKGLQAEAEVYAQTHRNVKVTTVTESAVKTQAVEKKKVCYFYWGDNCVKVYGDAPQENEGTLYWQKTKRQIALTLPGDFVLPAGLIIEEYTGYETDMHMCLDSETMLASFAKEYVTHQMISGRVITMTHDSEVGETNALVADFYCVEMIGIVRFEQSITDLPKR